MLSLAALVFRGDLAKDAELLVLRHENAGQGGLTKPEIARELHVSPNTVRTHVRNLYMKLSTHGRGETVDRARALGLLSPGRAVPRTRDRGADAQEFWIPVQPLGRCGLENGGPELEMGSRRGGGGIR